MFLSNIKDFLKAGTTSKSYSSRIIACNYRTMIIMGHWKKILSGESKETLMTLTTWPELWSERKILHKPFLSHSLLAKPLLLSVPRGLGFPSILFLTSTDFYSKTNELIQFGRDNTPIFLLILPMSVLARAGTVWSHPDYPHEWQGHKYLSHQLLPPRVHTCRKLG